MLRSIDSIRLLFLSDLPIGPSLLGRVAACLLLANFGEVATAEDATSASRPDTNWSQEVWSEALAGNADHCLELLQQVPADLTVANPSLAVALQQYNQNRSLAEAEVLADRAWAWDRVQQDITDKHPILALQDLIRVQTTWVDPSEILSDERAIALIDEVENLAAGHEAEGDLLNARQALYLLNTIYDGVQTGDAEDGTSATRRRDGYEQRLRILGRKVQILSLYAPAQFHEMRKDWAFSLGEGEDFPDFNPNTVLDWQEVTRGITEVPLLLGMRRAVSSHMDRPSWRPMLMEALRTAREFSALPRLATVEAFSGLGDAEKVAVWEEVIDSLMASIELDERVDFRRAREIIGQLLDTNTRSVQIPTSALVKEVGDAVLTSLDDYTGFIWPDEVRRFQQNTEGNFVGIGVQIRKAEDGGILVVAPLEESPAWKLGIQNKDVIVSVDGALVADWSLNDAVDRITGAEGTTVRLEVQRPEVEELLVFDVPRQRIEIPSVKGFQILERDEDGKPTWDWRLDSESKIGYFRLNQFARNSHLDLIKAWNTLCTQFDSEPNGVVLDLRGNPGGLLESAAAITNLFLREGTVVTQESPGGRIERRVWARPDGNVFGEVPVVVLVDEGSASASEIVSGALQAHRRAVVVGERTFGKGSVQTVQPAGRETFAKITEQYYRLPSVGDQPGRMVHKKLNAKVWGVDPQVEVWLPEGAEERRRGTWRNSDLRYSPTLNAPELLNEESELDPERVDSPDEPAEVKEPASPQSPYAMKEIEPGFDPNRTLQEGLDPALEFARLLLLVRGSEA
ncbi:MAG: S41 family peptidase [Planctomycetota bacterium]|jgi:carboxyl-terminal processing protease|nr:MAG: PDZ domain-containing protein [Phycisphaeraceae bacterium]